ncbi:MAG: NifB/NifX family molybdenum-iron cluster-binding protein [Bacteroidales bacterium]
MIKKIVVPADENGLLDAHFGHCRYFIITETEEDRIIAEHKLIPPPHEPGVLPRWLADQGATDIIAGGMGQRAIQLFNQYGVNVFVGAPRLSAAELIAGMLTGSLNFAANYCDH